MVLQRKLPPVLVPCWDEVHWYCCEDSESCVYERICSTLTPVMIIHQHIGGWFSVLSSTTNDTLVKTQRGFDLVQRLEPITKCIAKDDTNKTNHHSSFLALRVFERVFHFGFFHYTDRDDGRRVSNDIEI